MVFVPEAMIRIGPVDPVPAVPDPGIIPGWRNINDVRVERRQIEGFGRCLDTYPGGQSGLAFLAVWLRHIIGII